MPLSDGIGERDDTESAAEDSADERASAGDDIGGVPTAYADEPQQFGVGIMPATLMRFNWGAFFLPALWGVVYSVWLLVSLWFLATFAPLFLGIVFGVTGSNGSVVIPALIGITVVSDAGLAFVRLWTGGYANQLYWDREARRLAADPKARPKTDVNRFASRQRLWVVWGALGLSLAMAFTLVTNYAALKPYGLGWAFVAEPIVFLGAQIGLGIWLDGRMRAENAEARHPEGAAPRERDEGD
jgi:hypothetical protein